jgi:phosphatidylserine decarboxylase
MFIKFEKEVIPYALTLLIITYSAFQLNHLIIGTIFAVLLLFVLYFFRDPKRITPNDPTGIYSPADGLITEIKDVTFDDQPYTQVVIFLSIFNVHINRIPYDGKVIQLDYFQGDFHSAFKKELEGKNERQEIIIETDKGKIKVVQMAGLIARRIVCRLTKNQDVKKGEKFGLIKFSSRTDLYLPKTAQLNIAIGNKVKGGITKIASFS